MVQVYSTCGVDFSENVLVLPWFSDARMTEWILLVTGAVCTLLEPPSKHNFLVRCSAVQYTEVTYGNICNNSHAAQVLWCFDLLIVMIAHLPCLLAS
jgi:hypothetical protein